MFYVVCYVYLCANLWLLSLTAVGYGIDKQFCYIVLCKCKYMYIL